MGKQIRLSDDVYKRLENLTEGFDTPSETISKILQEYECLKAYQMMNDVVEQKIKCLIDEQNIESLSANILMHYDSNSVEQAINKIISENQNFNFIYEVLINGISLNIAKK